MNALLRPLAVRPHADIRLFCFPYAGGGLSAFRGWADGLPETVEPWAVQLPGREDRTTAAPLDRMSQVLNALVPAVIPCLDRPFAFFGHSMGALIAWELARALQRLEAGAPRRLFVSGCVPPQTRTVPDPPLHTRPDADLIRTLRDWHATPEAVLADPELMALLLPAIRADLAVVENHRYAASTALTCPVTAFGGTGDGPADGAPLERWGELTTGGFDLRMFPGDHFFVHAARPAVLAEIAGRIAAAHRAV
ncbi:thioesterase II family protein [Streptomyces sp. NPDC018045]|uniref:thioesterase II family protein n=1 Tax=Streptomyces sp. NPDC018045 TaxID=3365037 RepID=UPI0037A79012